MQRNHSLRIKKIYYNQINNGTKKLEIRVGYSQIKKIRAGDTITFSDYSDQKFEVVRVTRYNDFAEMLDLENPQEVIPNVSKYKALDMLQEIYPEDKEKLGVYVIELRKLSRGSQVRKEDEKEVKILRASNYIDSNHKLFSDIVSKAYNITDNICKDYPKHFEWYWKKTVPAVLEGTREIIVATIDKKIVGIVFLKKEADECKICTLLVLEEYRGKGIATMLLKEAFEYLGTTKPLITIGSHKIEQFSAIIKKYNWKQTQVLNEGYYNDTSKELVFNGNIS